MDSLSKVMEIIEITRSHNRWRGFNTLNMIASENIMSPLAEALYVNDMMFRYAEGKPKKRYYQGTRYIDEVEILCTNILGELLGTQMVDIRAISGTIANAASFRVIAQPEDKALIAPVQAGSHVSHTKFGTLGALGIEHIYMPYDDENINVDIDKAVKMIYEIKPKLVVLGGSLYLFPHPAKELSPHVKAVGGKLVYDAAHVLGLIVGNKWHNALKEGADVLTASTHKTFPGPQGGLIASSNEELFKNISKTIFPWFISNHHLHRLPSLAVTALEMKEFGEAYADQIIRNSRTLAESLREQGFNVIGEHLGFTKSHQIAVDVSKVGGGASVAERLEKANIIVNKNLLPKDPPDAVSNPSGIRIGTQEITRLGMKEGEMIEIAKFFREVLIDGKDVEEVKRRVIAFRQQFNRVHYTFNIDLSELNKGSERSIPLLY
jgi:glycine hydroxymethyltransferase